MQAQRNTGSATTVMVKDDLGVAPGATHVSMQEAMHHKTLEARVEMLERLLATELLELATARQVRPLSCCNESVKVHVTFKH